MSSVTTILCLILFTIVIVLLGIALLAIVEKLISTRDINNKSPR